MTALSLITSGRIASGTGTGTGTGQGNIIAGMILNGDSHAFVENGQIIKAGQIDQNGIKAGFEEEETVIGIVEDE